MRRAMLWEAKENKAVQCRLCAHGCLIKEGKRGICQVRQNQDGTLFTLVWGKPISGNPDPIEKKPLYHFQPGTRSYSIATIGCNFRCAFCQNWEISQHARGQGGGIPGGDKRGGLVEPQAIVDQARAKGCASISYTYTEPTIYFEYAYDCMRLAVENGLKNVFVTNGYESKECVDACLGLLHAANVDLKSFNDDFYKNECKARLQPVLDTLKRMHDAGIWLEITTLLIPSKNDDPEELRDLAGFIANELSPEVPWHVSAYTPRYKYTQNGPPSTPVASLEMALQKGRETGLKYLYAGNMPGHDTESTFCPACGDRVIKRQGFFISANTLQSGICPHCGVKLHGVWQ